MGVTAVGETPQFGMRIPLALKGTAIPGPIGGLGD
jgi:hypothetical protein